uniref:Retrotransposon protein, putative, unclassified n=1 Tax=Oryza sativa subsp. japonica TaxID=39947 RepID=Q2QQK0_ORYSJ|nr:retrotransposon protein, putative, unclassified [Oryza sativa Japonica Group]
MTGDKDWFSSLKKASKTESIVFADASTSAVVATGLVMVNENFELKNVALVKDLKYNLLSVSQIVDEEFEVHFKKTRSKIFDSCGDSVLNISRYGRVFKADFENSVSPVITCLVAKFDKDVMFWHRRLGHVGFDHLTRLSGLDLVRGLPKLKKDLDLVCTPCRHAKMVSTSHAPIVSVMTDAPGQLLHMDTVGPARVQSVGGKWYALVIVDDFSRYSWVFFMATKDEAFQHFRGLFLRLELEFPGSLKRIRSDNGGEFKNASFEQFCNERGTLSQVQGEDGHIFEDESDYDDDDEVGSAGQTGRQAGQTAGTPPVRPTHEERSDRPGSSGSGTVGADRDGPPENSTSISTETERGSTSEVAAPLHIQRRHPPEQIIGNISERTTRSKEEVYVKQPPGFENLDFPNHVFKLSKALYGLKQAPRAWYDRLKNFLLAKGFTMGKVDKTLFVLKHGDNQLFVQIYVDDIIFGCSTHALVVDFAETMRKEFEMSMMGELSYFLGLQIKQTPQGTFVHQTKYTNDLLRRFKMENCKPISTPIGSTAVLDPDEDGEAVDQKEYRSMIVSLLYLTASRPDIQFAVCLCARFQASTRASHRQAVKRIMRYLNHTLEFVIWYSTSSSICLSGYSDADFGGCRIDRKSTSGTCHFLGTSLIAWSSRKQSSVAQSTAESEYVAAASCCSQILWLLSTLKDYGLTFEKVPLFCDNTSAINIAKNPVQHSRTKHIDIRFHFLRDHVEKGDVELQFLDTKLQIADIFTKPLDSNLFAFLRGELGIIHPFGMV